MRISDWSSDVCSSDLSVTSSSRRRGCTRWHARCKHGPLWQKHWERCRTMATKPAPLPGAEGLWTRRLWLRCAAVSGCLAMIIWVWGNLSGNDLETRTEEHTSELQTLMRISYSVFCLKKTTRIQQTAQ